MVECRCPCGAKETASLGTTKERTSSNPQIQRKCWLAWNGGDDDQES